MGNQPNGGIPDDDQSVAIVGLSCRFPGEASDADAFWELLSKGQSALSKIPKDRFDAKAFHGGPIGGLNSSVTDSGHFIKGDIKKWDANFFGITPEEAEAMDPQQRLMMEVAFEAFENAGITPDELSGSNTGCWMGVNSNDWRETLFRDPEAAPMHTWTGTGPEYISGRVSWFYNMRGPSMTINTACSSSLVALHQARQSIQSGECEMAIVGGANLIFNPEYYLFYSNQKFLSADGKCKSFDATGDGFGRGEGLGALILKRTSSAVRDGDAIRAVVRGTGVGQDGWTSGITLPNADAQAELIRRTYQAARLPLTETQYVEAHGTGTKVGDPAEIEAIYNTLGGGSHPLLIGSVKTNIGHLEGAAGIAGVIKAVLMLEKGEIPPTVGITSLNPKIQWDKWRLEVVDKLKPWPGSGPRRISISSFGASGTIAHAILDDARSFLATEVVNTAATEHAKLFLVSANDPGSMRRQTENLHRFLREHSTPSAEYLQRLALTLSSRRAHFPYRSCLVSSSVASLCDSLEANVPVHRASASALKIGFVFTGQGAQWARMGMGLLMYPVFRRSIERADEYLRTALGCRWSAMEELLRDADHTHIHQAEYSQPLCTVLQLALVDLLNSWNITPTAVVGHSSGEIAAAYCLGALSESEAWTAAYWRGNVDKRSALPRGAMLAAGISPADAASFIAKVTRGMAVVGCINSPSSVTLSGDEAAISELADLLTKAGHFNRRLKVDTAYHSPHLSEISNEYLMRIKNIRPKPAHPGRTMHSSVTGRPAAAATLGPGNWVRNLISPVLFAGAVESMLKSKQVDVVLEVGPHAALAAPTKTTMAACGIDKEYFSVLSRNTNDVNTAMEAAANLLARGVAVNVKEVNRDEDAGVRAPMTNLPAYSWNHEASFWAPSRWDKEYRQRPHPAYRFVGAPMPQIVANEHIWRAFIRPSEEHWIVDHKIQGVVVYPAVGYVAMAVEAARQLASADRPIRAFTLRDVRFLSATEMNETAATEMTLSIVRPPSNDDQWYRFSISSCSNGTTVRLSCTGHIRIDYAHERPDDPVAHQLEVGAADIRDRFLAAKQSCRRSARPEVFYDELARIGLEFGPAFQNIVDIRMGEGQSYCVVNVVNPAGERDHTASRPFIIHPATFDPITQTIMAATGLVSRTPIPTAIGELVISANVPYRAGEQLAVFTDVKRRGHHAFLSDIHALDPTSLQPVLALTGLKLAQIASREQVHDVSTYHVCSQIVEQPSLELLMPTELGRVLGLRQTAASLKSQLGEFICMLHHSNPALSVLELSDPSVLDNGGYDAPKVHHAKWNHETQDLSPLEAGATYDVCVFVERPSQDETSISVVLGHMKGLLGQSGFICAIGPGAKLEAALQELGAQVYARLESQIRSGEEHSDVLIVAGMRANWNSPFTGSDMVILEPETPSETSNMVAEALFKRLESQKYRPLRIQWPAAEVFAALLKRTRCVSLMEIDRPLIADINEHNFQELQRLMSTATDVLWVTAGDDPSFYAVDGMVRSIRNEDASTNIRVLHLSSAQGDRSIEMIARAAASNTQDREFSVDENGIAYTVRIKADPALSDLVSGREVRVHESMPLGAGKAARRLEIAESGQLDTLHFVEDDGVADGLQADEVLLQVAYSGLNFKDVMIALGRVEGTMEGAEGSGTVLEVGSAVTSFSPGDHVLCLGIGTHSSVARIKAVSCRPLPPTLTLREAASVPVVHCTAYNAFVRIARPEAGQSALIHAGAGGLGQVAIQYAQHFGMDVFVTVGSPAKRDLVKRLYGIPDDHILSSRDDSFALAIRRMTHGRGVDVVLNSLSGDMQRESWRSLAPGGTFVEVGKAVLQSVQPPHDAGATYSTFDVEHIMRSNPALTAQLLDGALGFLQRGITRPVHPLTVFAASQVHDAVRLMQTGQHTGKLLLSWAPDDVVPVLRDGGVLSARLRPDATYVLVGGLGGVGRSLAAMLADLGARHLCFLGRSGAQSPAARALLDGLAAEHVDARAYACDVADESDLRRALAHCAADMPPVRGVLQCAAVFRDATFANQHVAQWHAAIRPKLHASWNIHHLLPRDLDFFVLLSSFAGLFGNVGQTSYAAGSSYQDRLAHFRRSRGLRATALDLGIIHDVGVLAETGMTENLAEWACFGIGETLLRNLVRTVIQDQISGTCKIPPQLPTGIASHGAALAAGIEPPFYLQDPRFSMLAHTGQSSEEHSPTAAGPSFLKRLGSAKTSEQAAEVITEMLVFKVAKCLGVTPDRIDPNRSLPAYGINSLVAIEVRNWIFKEAKLDVTIFDLISPLPIQSLIAKIVSNLQLPS